MIHEKLSLRKGHVNLFRKLWLSHHHYKKRHPLFLLYEQVIHLHVSVNHVCAMPVEARRGHQIPRGLE